MLITFWRDSTLVMTTFYTVDDMRRIVSGVGLDQVMDDTIEALTHTLQAFDPAQHEIPIRDGFDYEDPQIGLIEWMPAMKRGEAVTVKMVGYHPHNPRQQGLPTILSTVLCFDVRSGHLRAVMDGNLLTAIRTGAASAVASRILAKPDSSTLGLIGCGAQAVSQLHALSRVFTFRQVLVYDTEEAARDSFAGRVARLNLQGLEIQAAPLDRVVAASDIICTATSVDSGAGPVFNERLIRPTVHINAVGSDFPGKIEVPHALLTRSLVCPDFPPQAMREGECQQLESSQVGPDLLRLVQEQDRYLPHRDRITVFDSTGWALEDYVTMNLLMDYGSQLGCGTEVSIADLAEDPHDPYAALEAASRENRQAG